MAAVESTATQSRCRRHVRFSPDRDQIADVSALRFRANCGLRIKAYRSSIGVPQPLATERSVPIDFAPKRPASFATASVKTMTPMKLDRAYPVAALHDYVRCFEQREADIQGAAVAYSIAARPDQILEFYLRQPYMVRDCKSGTQDVAPSAVVVGPCTYRRIGLVLCGRFLVFTIHFHASGFHQLFRAPMHELVDCAHDAESVIGNSVLEIEQRLAEASEFGEQVRAATVFLLQRLTARPSFDPVAMIANRFPVRGALRVGDAAVRAGLNPPIRAAVC